MGLQLILQKYSADLRTSNSNRIIKFVIQFIEVSDINLCPVGVAAAAAIVSAKKRKRPHSFETNPSIRKRQQNRLLRKLRQTIDEFATRVGQQAVVVVATPGKPQNSFKVFGAKPLEDVMRNIRTMIMDELESALAQQAPPPVQEDPSLYELPPLIIDGIPTPVEKMTQAQLRAFIPLMLKYSTGRGKPGWGRESTRPPWWPKELPWANVRMDARTEDEKQKISWTHALRQIVINCYKYHGREDLLPAFSEDEEANGTVTAVVSGSSSSNTGSASLVGTAATSTGTATIVGTANRSSVSAATQATVTAQYAPAVLQTISNADGTVSIIQVDPNNPIITLPDGTTAQVQSVTALAEVGPGQGENVAVDLNSVTEATLNQDGQIILTAEDGHGYPVSVSGMITVPVTGSMYQTVVANLQHLHPQGEPGSLQGEDRLFQVVTPMVQVPKAEPGGDASAATEVEAITVTPQQLLGPHQLVSVPGEPQLLQVLSLKESPPTPGNAAVHTPPHRSTMQLLSLKDSSSTPGNAPVQTPPHRPTTPAGKRSAAVGPGESSVVEVSIDVKEEDAPAPTSVSGTGGSSSDQ
ncbi:DNA-binding protein P3A2 [Schistocerca gregaria]|uniref:DNA-binding protein P3A2 n=1 Tax=Schistocerca gregaria TaxID=7010 RepID=UPI00211E9C58|nr:DNA-binding protein P3A2 [Schistocerca gregaria]